jgi:hypothetical protein
MFHPDLLFSPAYTTAQAPHIPDLRRRASGKVTADPPGRQRPAVFSGISGPFIDAAGGEAVNGLGNAGACPGAEKCFAQAVAANPGSLRQSWSAMNSGRLERR